MILLIFMLISIIYGILSFFIPEPFFYTFLTDQAITIISVMLPINFASAGLLHMKLIEIEERIGRIHFSGTKKEIKHNVIFCFVAYLIYLILFFILSVIFEKYEAGNIWISVSNGVLLFLFLGQIYGVYETTIRFPFSIPPIFQEKEK